jgi:hypothetical protein
MVNTTPSLRVRRSAQLLDQELPGWVLHINVPKLDSADPEGSLLAQLSRTDKRIRAAIRPGLKGKKWQYGTYKDAALLLVGGCEHAAMEEEGFVGFVPCGISRSARLVNLLDVAWGREVADRLHTALDTSQ